MGGRGLGLLLLALCSLALVAGERHELQLGRPKELLSTDGGSVHVWRNIGALQDARIVATRITLRERGLVLPKYSDSPCLAYVEQGEGMFGILTGYSMGEGSGVRRVRRGDVVAVPRGIASWWYNTGSNSELRIIGLADSSAAYSPDQVTPFDLMGGEKGEEFGGILHGFKRSFLAEAWDMEESQVKRLLQSQRGVGIVQVDRSLELPHHHHSNVAPERTQGRRQSREGCQAHLRDLLAHGEFVYNVREGSADVCVRDAGSYHIADRFKLPTLENLKLGLTYTRLEAGAILAPHWELTGHEVLHVLRGDGEVHIVGPAGQCLESGRQIREGEAFVVPRFFADGIKAGRDGLEFISFYTTDQPMIEALAGTTSVLRNMPEKLAAAAFNVNPDLIRGVRERRQRQAILLPPQRRSRFGF